MRSNKGEASLKQGINIEIEVWKETLLSKRIDRSPRPILSFQGWVTLLLVEERKWGISVSCWNWITFEVGARMNKQSIFNTNSQTVRNWKITPFSFTNCAWLKNYTFWLENFPENFITWVDGNYIWLGNEAKGHTFRKTFTHIWNKDIFCTLFHRAAILE